MNRPRKKSGDPSPLITAIKDALRACPDAPVVRVSVTPEARWESVGDEHQVHVKWLCWNLEDGDGEELSEPEMMAAHGDTTEEELSRRLGEAFPGLLVKIDNEIDVEDDED